MNQNIDMQMPAFKHYEWQNKDATDIDWRVTADYQKSLPSATEEGCYETVWYVAAQSSAGYRIATCCETSSDSLITLLICDAALEKQAALGGEAHKITLRVNQETKGMSEK